MVVKMFSIFKKKPKVDLSTQEPLPFKTLTITTTELSNLAGMPLQSKLIKNLGIQPFAQTKTGVYWATEDVPDIFMAISKYLREKAMEELNKK
jgi:hypothetical protein